MCLPWLEMARQYAAGEELDANRFGSYGIPAEDLLARLLNARSAKL